VVSEKKVKEIRQKVKNINGSEICKLTDNERYVRLKHNRRCNIGTELAPECSSGRVLYQKTTAQMRTLNLCNKKRQDVRQSVCDTRLLAFLIPSKSILSDARQILVTRSRVTVSRY
jgi:hypothetical protein